MGTRRVPRVSAGIFSRQRWRSAIFARGKYISLFNFAGGSISEGKREIDSQRERERNSAPPRAKPRKCRIADGFGHGFALKPPVRLRCSSAAASALRTLHFRPGSIATRRNIVRPCWISNSGQIKSFECINFLSVCSRRLSDSDDQSKFSLFLSNTLPNFI